MRLETAEQHLPPLPDAEAHGDRPAERVLALWPRYAEGGRRPEGLAPVAEAVAYAVVDDGRWVVRCPFCPSAQVAAVTDKRFFCVTCENEPVGGRWVRVRWPTEAEAELIETLMLARPRGRRYWEPGEPVEQLARENVDNGYPTGLEPDTEAAMLSRRPRIIGPGRRYDEPVLDGAGKPIKRAVSK